MPAVSFLRQFLSDFSLPQDVDLSVPYNRCRILVVDIETNSLEVKLGDILSLGWVAIEKGEVRIGSGRHLFIDSPAVAGESTKIHGIRDIDRRGGISLRGGMETLYNVAQGSVLLFHHAGFDLKFLNAAAAKTGLPTLRRPHIDTLLLEQRRRQQSGKEIVPGTLSLANCRKRYALPRAPQHNALEDALATAELALVMFASMSGATPLPVKYFIQNKMFFF
jgi:DNA polymerase III subunit epsilon